MSENKKARIGIDLENHSITRNDTTFIYETTEAVWNILTDKDKRVLLHGFAQYVGDCVAGKTLKGGYTSVERVIMMTEKAIEINKGIFRATIDGEKVVFKNVRAKAGELTSMNELRVLRKLGLASKEQLAKLDEFEKIENDRLAEDNAEMDANEK